MEFWMWIMFGAVAVTAAMFIWGYNAVIRDRVAVEEGWSQIEVQLRRRYDLIPNLVATVEGYATHERETFDAVTRARAAAIDASGPAASAKAEGELMTALKSLFAVAEAYPTLQASANFLSLQEELATTENKIGFARQRYNDLVRVFNTRVQTFPGMFFAKVAGAARVEFFDAPDVAAEPPQVSFQ